jgi:3-deoxy-D-manno-octulosonic-acid transferase
LVLAVYSAALLLVMVLGLPWWLLRMATSGRYRAGLAGRLGLVPAEVREAVRGFAGRDVVWVHAVSVGEVLAASELVKELLAAGFGVAVSTTTQAGQELARKRFAGCAVFYMPLDLAWLMGRYLGVLGARLVVTMESELWPNLIHQCKRAGIPLAVVNARVSDRSFPRYMRLRGVWGPLLREVSLFLAQSEETAERLRAMGVGAEQVRVTGNLKYDVKAGEVTAMTRRIASLLWQARMIVAGSTLAGEEEMLLSHWPGVVRAVPDAVLLIAPRHTDRFDEVLGLVRQSGFPWFRCSHLMLGAEPVFGGTILLLDTIGDLASMYSAGMVAFVGGSLVARGGHNPLEPAQFGVPVVMGESYANFREIVGAMREAEAIWIVEREGLEGALVEMLTDRNGAKAMGERGRRVFEAQAGATGRTIEALMGLMGRGGD